MRDLAAYEVTNVGGGDITAGDIGAAVGGAVGGVLSGILGGAAGSLVGKAVGEYFGCESTVNACNSTLGLENVNLTM